MLVVADTSPINYLILIEQVSILPRLFSEIIIPQAVAAELTSPEAPAAGLAFMHTPPQWLHVVSAPRTFIPELYTLDPGETEAIQLALSSPPGTTLLIDERKGREVADQLGLRCAGTVGLLEQASIAGYLNLPACLELLAATNFHLSRRLLDDLLSRHKQRSQLKPS